MRLTWRWGIRGLATVAVAMAGAGMASGAAGGAYRGQTSQKQTVSFSISAGAVRSFKIVILDKCPDGHMLRVRSRFSAMRITKGKFGGNFRPAPRHRGERATLRATAGRGQVTGSLTDVGFSKREYRLCRGSARFTARRM